MKVSWFIFIIVLAISTQGTAQDTNDVFYLSEIPAQGLLLNKNWTFKAGNKLHQSNIGNDDSGWSAVDPSKEIHHLEKVRDAEVGWFRLKLKVDTALFGKKFALVVSMMGASEIFLNNQLIYRFGVVSADYSKEQTRYFSNHLLSLKLGDEASQVIAIHYSFNKRNLYLKFANAKPVARLMLKDVDLAFAAHLKDNSFDSTLRSIQVSFYLPLGFLLLFLFLSFRPQKEYLYSGIFCISMFAAILMHIFALSEPTTVSRSNYLLLATQILYIIGAIAFINGIYILYKREKSWFFYIIVLYGAWSLPFYFISYDSSGLFNACFFPIINFEFLRLNFLAVRKGRKGAGILLITSLLLTASLVCYILFTIYGYRELSTFLQSVSFIIPGIGLSLFFAGEFARTASDLQVRANEVELLSKEMIAKEREKQQILKSQKEILEQQVEERTAALTQSLKDLKETEAQLIQSEKMASLGELTAGIAHEIQNPLNFVNNFSEVNTELIEELVEEAEKGNLDEVKVIVNDIKENEQKINYHGKRADTIVKGMLQHSQSSSGKKEPTDINALANEYLRLAYHGLRAKDKSFIATRKTNFDKSLEKVDVVPQDIGRVILNLINNAFYAVDEKKKSSPQPPKGGIEFVPEVTVSTKRFNSPLGAGGLQIIVEDNGNGIPQNLLDKIFQPFFTTKPTGQGTGLGLSLSYDILKAHGGELKVQTLQGQGTTFTILLPTDKNVQAVH